MLDQTLYNQSIKEIEITLKFNFLLLNLHTLFGIGNILLKHPMDFNEELVVTGNLKPK
jgi:hypothetical protein